MNSTGERGFSPEPGVFLKVTPEPYLYRETSGPPEFPGYPHEYMTRSQTPVVTLNAGHNALRSAAFQQIQTVGFPLY